MLVDFSTLIPDDALWCFLCRLFDLDLELDLDLDCDLDVDLDNLRRLRFFLFLALAWFINSSSLES